MTLAYFGGEDQRLLPARSPGLPSSGSCTLERSAQRPAKPAVACFAREFARESPQGVLLFSKGKWKKTQKPVDRAREVAYKLYPACEWPTEFFAGYAGEKKVKKPFDMFALNDA